MGNQLSLLPAFDEGEVVRKANGLIDSLNDGMPKKELYKAEQYFKYNEYYIFVAENSNQEKLFNVLDINGNFPSQCSACWRSWQHILHELK